jgi:hypothetical protein
LRAPARPNGTIPRHPGSWGGDPRSPERGAKEQPMNGIIYLIGLIVVIMAILSFLGLR